jgi:hypothetical protein
MGPLPAVARQYLMGALFVVGLLVFLFGWLYRWILEG